MNKNAKKKKNRICCICLVGKCVGKNGRLEERWWKHDEELERTVMVTQRRWKILAVHGWKPSRAD